MKPRNSVYVNSPVRKQMEMQEVRNFANKWQMDYYKSAAAPAILFMERGEQRSWWRRLLFKINLWRFKRKLMRAQVRK